MGGGGMNDAHKAKAVEIVSKFLHPWPYMQNGERGAIPYQGYSEMIQAIAHTLSQAYARGRGEWPEDEESWKAMQDSYRALVVAPEISRGVVHDAGWTNALRWLKAYRKDEK